MNQHSEFWVLQKEPDPKSKEVPLYELPDQHEPAPTTVLISSEDLVSTINTRPLTKIFEDSGKHTLAPNPLTPYNWGLLLDSGEIVDTQYPHSLEVSKTFLDDEVVRSTLSIASGDKVKLLLDHTRRLATIVAVNGKSLKEARSWPRLESLEAGYSSRPLWVEMFGHYNLRFMTLLAPIPFGVNLYIKSPGKVGKTEICTDLWEALLLMTKKMPELHLILAYIGERDKDVQLYTKRYGKLLDAGKIDASRVELFISPKSKAASSQFTMFQLALQAAKRRAAMGEDAVVIVDSLSHAAGAHSFGGFAKSGEGMVPGGLYVESIQKVGQMLGPAGQYERGSLTFLNSVLEATGERKDPAVARFCTETEDNGPDATWTLLRNSKIGYPKASVDRDFESMTRRMELFVKDRQRENIDVAWKWATTNNQRGDGSIEPEPIINPVAIHARLKVYTEKNPIPLYVPNAEKLFQLREQLSKVR